MYNGNCQRIVLVIHVGEFIILFQMFQEAILKYNTRYTDKWNFETLRHFFLDVGIGFKFSHQ